MFWRYCECKINQTSMSVSLCSGLKLPWVQNPKKNLEIELWVLKVESCSLLLVTWGARRVIWAARQPRRCHGVNDNARHRATLLNKLGYQSTLKSKRSKDINVFPSKFYRNFTKQRYSERTTENSFYYFIELSLSKYP